jgi:hypothetical protein
MGVLAASGVMLTPIVRRNNNPIPYRHWGKWSGYVFATGDGSGGQVTQSLVFDYPGLYPPGLVWTFNWLSFYESVYAAGNVSVQIAPLELTGQGTVLTIDFGLTKQQGVTFGFVNLLNAMGWGLIDWPFHFPTTGSAKANLALGVANVNATTYYFRAGGWLDYEAYI